MGKSQNATFGMKHNNLNVFNIITQCTVPNHNLQTTLFCFYKALGKTVSLNKITNLNYIKTSSKPSCSKVKHP